MKEIIDIDLKNELTSMEALIATILFHARGIARKIDASAVPVYVDATKSRDQLGLLAKNQSPAYGSLSLHFAARGGVHFRRQR